MPIRPDEISPGIVAYLCTMTLKLDRRVVMDRENIGDMKTNRPYVCVETDGGRCSWIPLTSRNPRGSRLVVEQEWRRGGSERWQTGDVYVQCFGKEASGPRRSFVLAAAEHDLHSPLTRPWLIQEGMDVILRIRARKMRLDSTGPAGHDVETVRIETMP